MSIQNNLIEFDSPADRIVASQQSKNKFRIDSSLPDLGFLRQLSVQGRLRYFTGTNTSTTSDIITITPNVGETIFIYEIHFSCRAVVGKFNVTNDGNLRLVADISLDATSASTVPYFDSLVGDNIKSIIVESIATKGPNTCPVFAWFKNTSRIKTN